MPVNNPLLFKNVQFLVFHLLASESFKKKKKLISSIIPMTFRECNSLSASSLPLSFKSGLKKHLSLHTSLRIIFSLQECKGMSWLMVLHLLGVCLLESLYYKLKLERSTINRRFLFRSENFHHWKKWGRLKNTIKVMKKYSNERFSENIAVEKMLYIVTIENEYLWNKKNTARSK